MFLFRLSEIQNSGNEGSVFCVNKRLRRRLMRTPIHSPQFGHIGIFSFCRIFANKCQLKYTAWGVSHKQGQPFVSCQLRTTSLAPNWVLVKVTNCMTSQRHRQRQVVSFGITVIFNTWPISQIKKLECLTIFLRILTSFGVNFLQPQFVLRAFLKYTFSNCRRS